MQLRRNTQCQTNRAYRRCCFIQAGRSGRSSYTLIKTPPPKNSARYIVRMVAAVLTALIDPDARKIVRCPVCGMLRQHLRTASVVVFMPPAVEPGEPPISIRRIIIPYEALDIADRFYRIEARRPRRDSLKKRRQQPLSYGKCRKVCKEEKYGWQKDEKPSRDKDHLALHPIAMKFPLVFANVIPRQKANAPNHDQQHDRDIDHRTISIDGKGRILITFCS